MRRSTTVPAVAAGALLALAVATRPALSQVTASLTPANVSPIFAGWPSAAGQWTLVLNNSRTVIDVGTQVTFALNAQNVGVAPSDLDVIEAGTTVFNGIQIARWAETAWDPSVAPQIAATGRLPAGSWDVCVEMRDVDGAVVANPCGTFAVQPPVVQATLTAVNVTPVLADWSALPAQFTLITTSNIGQDVAGSAAVRLLRDGAQVGTTVSGLDVIPDGTTTRNALQIAEWDQFALTGAVAAAVEATGRLPDGQYDVCLDLSSPNTVPEFPPVTACASFPVLTSGAVTASLVMPNPSPYLADWSAVSSVMTLIVTNTTGQRITAALTLRLLRGDVEVGTAPGAIEEIAATPATTFLSPQVGRWDEFVLTGQVAQAVSQTGRLPESGDYQLCAEFTSLDAGGTALEPVGACAPFAVSFPQPPSLIAPADQMEVTLPYPTFQWTPVVSAATPQVSYLVRIVELLDGQTAVQAVAANPPVFEAAIANVTALLYPPSAYPLEVGKTYAWRVQAVRPGDADTPGGVQPVGANEGRSEVFTFTRTAVAPIAGGPPAAPPPTAAPPPQTWTPFWNAFVSGRLEYSFSLTDVPQPKRVSLTMLGPLGFYQSMGGPEAPPSANAPPGFILPVGTQPTLLPGGGLQIVSDRRPLAGVPVRLVVRYRTGGGPVWGSTLTINGKTYDDNGKVVASATTGPDGAFLFIFNEDTPTGLIAYLSNVSWGGGDFTTSIQGASVARYYNVEVGDPHYLTPSDEITLDQNQSADVGTLVSLVRSYRMAVRLKRFGTQSAPPPLRVQMLRALRPATVPKNEGTAAEPRQTWAAGQGASGPNVILSLAYEVLAEQSSGAGVTTFNKLVKNVGPADKYHLRIFSDPDGTTNYYQVLTSFARSWALQLGSPKPYDVAYYNEQYQAPTDTITLIVIPKPPRYLGEVVRTGTADPIASALAVLSGNGTAEQLRLLKAADSGRFVFENLKSNVKYTVYVNAPGFKPDSFAVGNVEPGQQIKHVHVMQPDAWARGRVVDETGAPLFARVRVADGPEVETYPVYQGQGSGTGGLVLVPFAIQQQGPPPPPPSQTQVLFTGNLIYGAKQSLGPSPVGSGTAVATGQIPVIAAWEFATFASSGQRVVHVDAGGKYLPLDSTVTVPAGNADLGVFRVYRALHRMRLRILEKSAGLNLPCSGKAIPGAVARLVVAGTFVDTADAQGWVEFAWEAPTDEVNVRISGPPDQDYVDGEPQFTVPVGTTPVQRCAYLLPGGRIGGVVYAGTGDSVPVANARVFVVGEGTLYAGLQDSTDAAGRYLIRRVPPGAGTLVRAGKSKSQFVGDSLVVAVQAGQAATADFHLRFYDGMDITQLLGFPIEVLSLTEVEGGAVIGGAGPAVPAHPTFAFATPGTTLAFDSVTIVPKGAGDSTAVPAAGRVVLSANTLNLHLFGTSDLLARQYAPASGLQIRDRGDGMGAVVGPVELRQESFTAVTPAELAFVTPAQQPVPLYLLSPGATGEARTSLQSVTADGATTVGQDGFDLGTAEGAAAPFRLFQFTADADPNGSAVKADGLHLSATVHTAIPAVGDLALAVPDLHILPGAGSGKGIKYPLAGEQQIQATLGQWTLQADAWTIGQGQIQLSKGKIVARLVPSQPSTATDFPFLGMKVTPTTLSGGQFGTGPIMLGGIAPMALPEALVFGREGGTGPWKLSGQNAVIGGLPGMRPADKLDLGIVIFRSDGEKTLSLKNGVQVQLYGTADYTVTGLGFDEKSVSLVGTLDLKVPGLPTKGGDVFYTRDGGATKFNMVPASWDPIDVNGAKLRILNGTLDSAGFHADAQVSVPDKFLVQSRFDRTPFTGSNQITATPKPEGSIDVGELKIGQLSGGATVANGAWDVAWDGALAVADEMSGKVSVAVEGATITTGSAGFSVKQVSTPFGDLTIVLDFAQQEIVGTLQFDGYLAEGFYANGAAELLLSGKSQDRYWYFFTGANFSLNSPKLSGVAALLVGNATLKDALLDKFDDYSTKGVPPAFYTIKGFFLDGKVTIPLPVCPSGGVDIGVAKVAVWCNAWGDLRLGMNFNELNVYHIGQLVGIGAGVEASFGLGLCVSVWGEASVQFDSEGEYRSDGAWYVWGQQNIGLKGGAEFGVGVDDVCLDKSKSFTIDLGVEAQLGYNWNTGKGSYYTVYFK
jgi:hypothetical protein